MNKIDELEYFVENFGTAPTFEKMPRRSLADKGINGPTGAHVIEEIHTPFNFAYITTTTGSTAFQNVVGVAHSEIPGRIEASAKALQLAGVRRGAKLLITYPPLVNVFSREALDAYGVERIFLKASSRDALLLELCKSKPDAVIGESSFLRAALEDAQKLGIASELPQGFTILAAGTPLDLELPPVAEKMCNAAVHDLYGCQEFGWLTLDGIPVREDITLLPTDRDGEFDLLAGGLPTGDRFPVAEGGHICNHSGKIITYSRLRTSAELEITVLETTASGLDTIKRLAKTILRIKAKIVRIPPDIVLGAKQTVLEVKAYGQNDKAEILCGKTKLFDSLLEAQSDYQSQNKTDPAWIKSR